MAGRVAMPQGWAAGGKQTMQKRPSVEVANGASLFLSSLSAHLSQRLPNGCVAARVPKGVQVGAHRAAEDHRVLQCRKPMLEVIQFCVSDLKGSSMECTMPLKMTGS